ncbi:hypothetical protein EZV73_12105 [Acidaminobacter sp. JC074]|uniref:hypothetical protein n=1 Tax=Acidaminobacter sp. JC074 TaxID=2530199 RepID=UPI001F0EEAFA|nr:hypothetical protein [Acidaminobacter sp. JC074]MCH4888324.1 hypothetical protein [Acidaminobacter sp. JC074]
MVGMTKLQKKILDDLYRRDILNEEIHFSAESYDLEEVDKIMRTRELVYILDQMSAMKVIDADDFYLESGMVSFEYMNKAVEIIEDRVKISKLGINYVEMKKMKGFTRAYNALKLWLNKQFLDRPFKYLISHLIAFVLGALAFYGITQFM